MKMILPLLIFHKADFHLSPFTNSICNIITTEIGFLGVSNLTLKYVSSLDV